jgi:hypothetical protein
MTTDTADKSRPSRPDDLVKQAAYIYGTLLDITDHDHTDARRLALAVLIYSTGVAHGAEAVKRSMN